MLVRLKGWKMGAALVFVGLALVGGVAGLYQWYQTKKAE